MIRAHVGRPFTVRLADRPGSGHAWGHDELPQGVRVLGRDARASPRTDVGGPSTVEIRLVADRPGSVELVFHLSRSWETEPVDQRRVQVDVDG